jgi:DNA invertase Pin-like site-specific DNA recombinase
LASYAYLRVSTDKQDLDNQRHGIIEYARQHGLEPLIFIEDTVSGTKDWRERDLSRLLDQAVAGDVLLVAEISRMARSTLQVLEILREAADKGVIVHVVKNRMVMDGSLHARITATVLGMAAEIEREFNSARTKESLARRKAEGKPLGRPVGAVSQEKKLDKRKDEIIGLLQKEVHIASIARIVDCSRTTLYAWMEANNLSAYINPRKQREAKPATHAFNSTPALISARSSGGKAQRAA